MTKEELTEVLSLHAAYLDEYLLRPAIAQVTMAVDRLERAIKTSSDAKESRTAWKMWGDYFREAAVLVFIFVPLEVVIPWILDPGHSRPSHRMQIGWVAGWLAVSFAMEIIGIWMERKQ